MSRGKWSFWTIKTAPSSSLELCPHAWNKLAYSAITHFNKMYEWSMLESISFHYCCIVNNHFDCSHSWLYPYSSILQCFFKLLLLYCGWKNVVDTRVRPKQIRFRFSAKFRPLWLNIGFAKTVKPLSVSVLAKTKKCFSFGFCPKMGRYDGHFYL